MRSSLATVLVPLMFLALPAGAAPLAAQQDQPVPPPQADTPSPERQQLERQLRQRIAQVVRNRLQLTDEQFAKLQAVNQKYTRERRDLTQHERSYRLQLRAELVLGDQANQGHVNDLLNQLMDVQQRRLELLRQEQQDLAGFLTPVQRAKYLALQEQLRQRIAQLRRQQAQRLRQRGAQGQQPMRQQRRRTPSPGPDPS